MRTIYKPTIYLKAEKVEHIQAANLYITLYRKCTLMFVSILVDLAYRGADGKEVIISKYTGF